MGKKVLAVFLATVILLGTLGWVYMKYIRETEYPVFVETVSGKGKAVIEDKKIKGKATKYKVTADKDEELTLKIVPSDTDAASYKLKKLVVNGEDCTKQVKKNKFTVTVTQKLTILLYFSKT